MSHQFDGKAAGESRLAIALITDLAAPKLWGRFFSIRGRWMELRHWIAFTLVGIQLAAVLFGGAHLRRVRLEKKYRGYKMHKK